MGDEVVHGATAQGAGPTRVSFSDVVRAHYAWDKQATDLSATGSNGARAAFDDALREFEKDAGQIIDAYWCRKEASAVALTKKVPKRRRLDALRSPEETEYRLFRVSDWETSDAGEIANLLHECDVLAIKAANGLEGLPQAVVMQWLQTVESHLLGFIERHRARAPARAHPPAFIERHRDRAPNSDDLQSFVKRERAELSRIEDYYQLAGEKRARMHYVSGMLVGVPILAVLAAVLVPVLLPFDGQDLNSDAMRGFYVSLTAGALGAVVSVLMRMSSGEGFTIDHELGRRGVFRLGTYRPLIGAVSGVAVYFLVQTPLLSIDEGTRTFQYYAILAFLAGFSERWTQVTLSGAMRTVDAGKPKEPSRPSGAVDARPPAGT